MARRNHNLSGMRHETGDMRPGQLASPMPWKWFLILVSCLLSPVSCLVLVSAETMNRIVAVVNDDIITESDVNTHLSELLGQVSDVAEDTDPAQVRQAVLERLIQDRLLLQEAKKL